LLSDLLNHFRNLLIFQISRGDLNLLEVSESEVAALKEQSAAASSDALMRILDTFAQAELNLRDAASKKIFLEVALLKAIEARNAVSIDSVLKQLNHLRGQGGGGSQPAPISSTTSAPKPAAQSAPPPKQNSAALHEAVPVSADLFELWSKLVETVGRVSPFVRTYLLEAHPVSFGNNLFIIGFDPEFEDHLGLVDNSRNHTLLQTKLAELGHPNGQIKFVLAEAPANRPRIPKAAPAEEPAEHVPPVAATLTTGTPTTLIAAPAKEKASVPFNKNDFKNDPLIQKALEIFKGQIVEVRA
jgi:DNA polymerase III subunit gamma/tau